MYLTEKIMKQVLSTSLLASTILMTGCATVISGTSESVTIDSSPQKAEVYIDGAMVGVTPMTLKLEKNKKDSVMVKKEGFKPQSRELTKQYDPVTLVSFFWDASTTDFITGAAMEYDPKSYYFELTPE